MVIGIVLVLVACALALGIGKVANRNIREYDPKKHESFLG